MINKLLDITSNYFKSKGNNSIDDFIFEYNKYTSNYNVSISNLKEIIDEVKDTDVDIVKILSILTNKFNREVLYAGIIYAHYNNMKINITSNKYFDDSPWMNTNGGDRFREVQVIFEKELNVLDVKIQCILSIFLKYIKDKESQITFKEYICIIYEEVFKEYNIFNNINDFYIILYALYVINFDEYNIFSSITSNKIILNEIISKVNNVFGSITTKEITKCLVNIMKDYEYNQALDLIKMLLTLKKHSYDTNYASYYQTAKINADKKFRIYIRHILYYLFQDEKIIDNKNIYNIDKMYKGKDLEEYDNIFREKLKEY